MSARVMRLTTAPNTCLCDACLALAMNPTKSERLAASLAKLLKKGPKHSVQFLIAYAASHDFDAFTAALDTWNRQGGHLPVKAVRQ